MNVSSIAAQIIVKAKERQAERVEQEETNGPYDWSDMDSLREYIAVLKSAVFTESVNTVYVTVADTWHGRLWSWSGAEMLDAASQGFNLPETVRIEECSPTTHALVW